MTLNASVLERLPSPDAKRRGSKWLMGLAKRARGAVATAIGAGLGAGLTIIGQAALIAHIVHAAVIDDVPLDDLVWPFAGLLAVYLVRAAFMWLGEVAGASAAARIKAGLRNELFDHVLALGPGGTSVRHSGEAASLIVDQVEALDGFFARFLPQMGIVALLPLAMLAVVFPVDWIVGVILVCTAPLIPLFMALVGMGAAALSRRQMRALARMSAHFLDRLQGMTTLNLFGQAQRELQAVAAVADDYRKRTMGVLRLAFLSSAVLEFFSSLAVAMVALYVGLSLLGLLTVGPSADMTLFVGLFVLLMAPDFFLPLRQLAAHYHDRAAAIGAAEEMLGLLDHQPLPVPAAPRSIPRDGPVSVRFEGVHLAYPEGPDGDGPARPALSGLTFDVAPGERIVLVGPSGAGKSTVLSLILGFVRADSGSVLLNGVDVTEAAPSALHGAVAWIGQTPHLFHGTVADNVRFARPSAGDDEVCRAVQLAGVADFLPDLPNGLETVVGERGFGLSGGQAQRVALARAFLKDAPLLLLDEPTARLDAANERLVLDGLERLAAGRTVLFASHNAAGIGWADRSVRLEAGCAVDAVR